MSAVAGYNDRGDVIIDIRFNTEGARKFAVITEQNVQKPIAIVIAKTVVSMPIVVEPVKAETVTISGAFTIKEADTLVRKLTKK